VVVQLLDGTLSFLVGGHLDEAEASGATGGHVAHDLHALDVSTAGEELLEILFAHGVWKVPNVEFSTHAVCLTSASLTAGLLTVDTSARGGLEMERQNSAVYGAGKEALWRSRFRRGTRVRQELPSTYVCQHITRAGQPACNRNGENVCHVERHSRLAADGSRLPMPIL
jgi:hypothetical protein